MDKKVRCRPSVVFVVSIENLDLLIFSLQGEGSIREELDFTIRQEALKLEFSDQLGQGGFGKVFKTNFKGNPVAVKVIKTVKDKDAKRIPLTEGKLLRYIIIIVDQHNHNHHQNHQSSSSS